jgi:hypothetical protein
MSRWDDQFESHRVFEALANARRHLDSASDHMADVDQRDSYARLMNVLDYVNALLQATDPEFVWTGLLDQLAASTDQITTHLQQFASSPDATYLDQANAQADSLVSQAPALAVQLRGEGEAPDFQRAVTTFRRSAAQHLRAIESEVHQLHNQATEIQTRLSEQDAKLQSQDARLDAIITDYQSQFSTAEAQRAQVFNQSLAEQQTTLQEAITTSKDTVGAELAHVQEEIGGVLETTKLDMENKTEEIAELRNQAVRAVGVIGNTGLTGNYQRIANEEKKAGDFWRWLAVAGFALAAIGNAIILYFDLHNDLDLTTTVATRLSVSVPLLALAAYAVAESRNHRHREDSNRQMELQLASIDPYLAQFTDERKLAAKEGIIDRFFPGRSAPPKLEDDAQAD